MQDTVIFNLQNNARKKLNFYTCYKIWSYINGFYYCTNMLSIGISKAERDSLKSAGTIPRVCSALGSTKHSPHVSCKATEYHSPLVNTRRHISTSVSYHVIRIRNQKAQFVTKKKKREHEKWTLVITQILSTATEEHRNCSCWSPAGNKSNSVATTRAQGDNIKN